jgi:hypothetical protein
MLARTATADRTQTAFALLAAATVMAIAGCGGDHGAKVGSGAERAPATTAAAAPAAPGGLPRSVVVLGHSGATGENSDPSRPGAEVRENSWATGTNPAVNSVYARMLATNPAVKGHNINLAQGGATVRDLVSQAEIVGPLLPKADLVLIQIMDNDIDCPTTAGELATFGSTFRTALETLAKGAPESRWLVVSQFGSPTTGVKTLTLAQRRSLGGTGPCDLLDPAGRVMPGPLAKLEQAIHGYESQLTVGCKRFTQCRYDGGAFGRIVDKAEYMSSDLGHFSIEGHAKAAAVAWTAMRRAGLVPSSG